MRIFITGPMQQPLGQLKYGGCKHLMNENTELREKGCSGTGISAHLAGCIRAFPFGRWRPARETRPGFLSDRRF